MALTATKTEVDVSTSAMDASSIRAIQLADGWHAVNSAEFEQFAVGRAHSPITPGKLYPSLRYTNENGVEVVTPLDKISSYSEDPDAASSLSRRT